MEGQGIVEQWVKKNSTVEYYVNSYKNTSAVYDDASTVCMSMGGILASVLTEQIQIFLETIIPSNVTPEQSRFYWIGARREPTLNSNWKWRNNETLTYTNWKDGEGLINATNDEYCGSIWSVGMYKWYDNVCHANEEGFVCQRNIKEITTTPATTTTESTTDTTSATTLETTMTTLQTTTTTEEETTVTQIIAAGFQGMPIESIVVPVVAVFLAIVGLTILGYICYRNRKRQHDTLDITTTMDEPEVPDAILQMTEMPNQNTQATTENNTTQSISNDNADVVTYSTIQHNNDNNTSNGENHYESMPLSPTAHTSTEQGGNCRIDRPNRLSVFGNSTYGMVINGTRKKKSSGRDSYIDVYSSPSKKWKNNLRKSKSKV